MKNENSCFLSIKGETPSKKNSRINTRSGRSFPSKKYQSWEIEALKQIKEQNKNFYFDKSISFSVTFYHGDFRKRDSDNQISSLLDMLKKANLISDDNWTIVRQISVSNGFDKDNPRAEICIKLIGS